MISSEPPTQRARVAAANGRSEPAGRRRSDVAAAASARQIMGILNVTPDSFSDGGHFLASGDAVAHGRTMVAEGAHIIDVGGESTRPGAQSVPVAEELVRVIDVVEQLSDVAVVSIDTRSEAVARAAVAAGATIINDVGAGLGHVAADLGVGWIAMHSPAAPSVMAHHTGYDDVVGEVTEFLVSAASEAVRRGAPKVWIDPGIGFGKDLAGNLDLLAHLDQLVASGWPVALGTSRKSSMGALSGRADRRAMATALSSSAPEPAAVVVTHRAAADPAADDRLEASLATAVWAAAAGVELLRVHDVAATVAALDAAGVTRLSATTKCSTTAGALAPHHILKER